LLNNSEISFALVVEKTQRDKIKIKNFLLSILNYY
jgi:hypothetical protein